MLCVKDFRLEDISAFVMRDSLVSAYIHPTHLWTQVFFQPTALCTIGFHSAVKKKLIT